MRKILILLTALTGIAAAAPMFANAAPAEHPGTFSRAPAPAVQPVDYYWSHHYWHHHDWNRNHHRWHYYD